MIVNKVHPDAKPLYMTNNGLPLHSTDFVEINANNQKLIDIGIVFAIPQNTLLKVDIDPTLAVNQHVNIITYIINDSLKILIKNYATSSFYVKKGQLLAYMNFLPAYISKLKLIGF